MHARPLELPCLHASQVRLPKHAEQSEWELTAGLVLQQARSLIKALGSAQQGQKVQGHAAYLQHLQRELGSRSSTRSADCWRDPENVTAALRSALCLDPTTGLA